MYGRVGEYELFRTWHWFHRLVAAGRMIPSFRERMWDLARVRIRDLLAAPWDPPPPAAATIPDIPATADQPARRVRLGDVFTSERSLALVYRWHIYSPAQVLQNGRAAQRLRQAFAAAQGPQAPTQPPWGQDPTAWGDQHETALIWALQHPPHPASLTATLADVAAWPQPAAPAWLNRRFTLPVNVLPAAERQLKAARGSFQLDDRGLPPQL